MPSSKKLLISGPATRDLERIGDYTRAEWGAAQKRKYLGQIKDGFKALRDTPRIGARRDDINKGIPKRLEHGTAARRHPRRR